MQSVGVGSIIVADAYKGGIIFLAYYLNGGVPRSMCRGLAPRWRSLRSRLGSAASLARTGRWGLSLTPAHADVKGEDARKLAFREHKLSPSAFWSPTVNRPNMFLDKRASCIPHV